MSVKHRATLLAITLLLSPSTSHAHAVTGNRTFPATLAVEDPGAADELTLPQITSTREAGGARATETEAEFSKRLTENFALSAGATWVSESGASGWDNFSAGAKYVFFQNAPHEFMAAAGVDWDIGGSGNARAGAEDFSVVTPTLFFGKGMGDLPQDMLRPLAFTGAVGLALPTDRHDDAGDVIPRAVEWGFTAQYSLPYLQQHVKDIGLSAPFSMAIPIVELALDSPLNGGGRTTGTVNPGVIFMGEGVQFGLEAVVPVNGASGRGAGVSAQLHFYLEDLFPAMGKTLW